MPKKKGYTTAKKLIPKGEITNVSELLDIVDKTPLSKDIKTTPERFNKLIEDPTLFEFGDAINIANVIGVDEKALIDMVYAEILLKRKKRK
jgi:hypothetical protein